MYTRNGPSCNNFHESGLLVDTSPASHSWGDSEADKMRIGNVIYTKHLKKFKEEVLYVPDHHQQIAEQIYAQHGINATMAAPSCKEPILQGESKLWSTTDFVEGWTMIGIEAYGADILAQVSDRLGHACSQGITAIQMALPLHNPDTKTMTAKFEDIGFFFAGVCPVHDSHENLILQYISTAHTDYESIHVHSELAHEIKQYVMSCDPRVCTRSSSK